MGANMARHLKDCGYTISGVFDIDDELKEGLASELGATVCASLAAVTACSDIVFTVVTNDAAMESLFFGDDNLFTDANDTLFINCATLSPDIHRKLEAEAAKVGAAFSINPRLPALNGFALVPPSVWIKSAPAATKSTANCSC